MAPEREAARERAATGATAAGRPRTRLDQPQPPRRRFLPEYDPEAFGRLSERIARFLGTGRFIVWMTVVIILWVVWNVSAPRDLRFDNYPFIFLTLMLSLQASYAAPLILLAQNRQDDRDRVNLEQDRKQNERSIADTEYLTRRSPRCAWASARSPPVTGSARSWRTWSRNWTSGVRRRAATLVSYSRQNTLGDVT